MHPNLPIDLQQPDFKRALQSIWTPFEAKIDYMWLEIFMASQIWKKIWWFLIWSPHMSLCWPTLAQICHTNMIHSILVESNDIHPQSWAKNQQIIKK